ncbi:Rieske 2Fe-2S domain-containing protein [Rhizorhabdus histidinilytica]
MTVSGSRARPSPTRMCWSGSGGIFDRCWLYIGHESELPNPNDFVRRSVGGRDLIFNRDRKGDYHAFFNSCPHRGAAVVREDKGSSISFKCFYHGWSFNNNGAFATRFAAGTYPDDFNKDGCANLVSVPRLAGYAGFWFVNFDANAESLEDYLAGAKDFLQVVADHAADGMEIVGGIQEYSVRANWKLLVENSFDGYHAHETHSTYLEYLVDAIGGPAELFPSRGNISRAYDLGNGHAVIEGPAPGAARSRSGSRPGARTAARRSRRSMRSWRSGSARSGPSRSPMATATC